MSVFVDLAFLGRVMQVRYGSAVGSSVYIEVAGVCGLATAAHIFAGAQAGDKFAVKHKGEWAFVEVMAIEFEPNGADICLVVPTTRWGEGLGEDQLHAGLAVGQDVVYCGFPLGIEVEGIPGDAFPMPLVKGALFSGGRKINGATQYLFDTVNNVGFSGGPVVARDPNKRELHVAAIVSGYHFDQALPVRTKNPDGTEVVDQHTYVRPNSGFMYAVPIHFAKEALRRYSQSLSSPNGDSAREPLDET